MLVEVNDFEKQTASGIVLPEVWKDGRRLDGAKNTGVVVSIGDGADSETGTETKRIISIGDTVVWKKHHASYTFKEGEKTYCIIKLEHVLCKYRV